MPRLYDIETEHGMEYHFEDGDMDIVLHDDNIFANIHEYEILYDRVVILDPRDENYFQWWRYDQDPEIFGQMIHVASEIGSVLLRHYAGDGIKQLFDVAHHMTDNDFDNLLGDAA